MFRCCLAAVWLCAWLAPLFSQEAATQPAEAEAASPEANSDFVTVSPVLPMTVEFDVPEAKPVVVSGTFLNNEGLVLTVLPESKAVKKIVGHGDTESYRNQGVTHEVQLLARDARTGLALVKSPYRCVRPFVFCENEGPAEGNKLHHVVLSQIREDRFLRQDVVVTAVKQTVTFLDGREVSGLCELQVGYRGNFSGGLVPDYKSNAYLLAVSPLRDLADPGTVFAGDQRTIVSVALATAGTAKASDRAADSRIVTCAALPGRDAREICNRLLKEANLPPLPAVQQAKAVFIPQDLSPHAIRLEIDYDNGDRGAAIGVFMDDAVMLVPTDVIQRARLVTYKQNGLEVPLTVGRKLPEVGISLLERSQWPQDLRSVRMALEPTPLKPGDYLMTSPPKVPNQPVVTEAKVKALGLTDDRFGSKRSGLIEIDYPLDPGTPLYRQGEFVAVVTSRSREGTSLAIAADDFWLAWVRTAPLNQELLDEDEQRLRNAGKPVVRLLSMPATAATVMANRLKPLFPGLTITVGETGEILVVSLDPKQETGILSEMEILRRQLSLSLDSVKPKPSKVASQFKSPIGNGENPPKFSHEEAVALAKWNTSRQTVPMQVEFEGQEAVSYPIGTFLGHDGVLLTLIASPKAVTKITVVMEGKAEVECTLVARDPDTGVTLVASPFHCRYPLKLADKFDPKSLETAIGWNIFKTNQFKGHPRFLSGTRNISFRGMKPVKVLFGTTNLYNPTDGDQWGECRVGEILVGQQQIQALSYGRIDTTELAEGKSFDRETTCYLPADQIRTVCNRMLREREMVPLEEIERSHSKGDDTPAAAGEVESTIPLFIEHDNGDRSVVKSVVLDRSGGVACDVASLDCLHRVRWQQTGLSLEPQVVVADRLIGALKLGDSLKKQSQDISLDIASLKNGDSLFEKRFDPDQAREAPSARIIELDATLETYDRIQTHLIRCDRSLMAGTTVFNEEGLFVGICLETPQVFTNTTFIMPADQVWKQALPLLQPYMSQFHTIDLDRQYVKTYRFIESVSNAIEMTNGQTAVRDFPPVKAEILEKIHLRLQKAFPDLQVVLRPEEKSIVVVVEPPLGPAPLTVVDAWIVRLLQERQANELGDRIVVPVGHRGYKVLKSDWVEAKKLHPKQAQLFEIQQSVGPVYYLSISEQALQKSPAELAAILKLLNADSPQAVPPGPSTALPSLAKTMDPQIQEILKRYHAAPVDQRKAVQNELLELTTQQFDRRHQQRLNELKVLEGRLESLRAELQKRQELKADIIRKRVADLLSDETLLQWDAEEESKPAPAGPKPVGR